MKLNRPEEFAENFLSEFVHGGFGSIQKRDIDVLVFNLLLADGQYDLPKDMFKASRELKITETKIRNLYQAAQLKYSQYDELKAKEKLIELIRESKFEKKGDRLIFVVRDPLLRQFFEEWVSINNSFTDSSFNKNIVTVSISTFHEVLDYVSIDNIDNIKTKLEKIPEIGEVDGREEFLKMFVKEFVKAAAKEAGAKSIGWLVSVVNILLLGS